MRQSLLSRVNRDLSGATAIEYALLAGLVGVAAIGALAGLGKSLDNNFDGVQSSFDQATRSARVGSDDAPDTPSGEPGPNAPIAPDAASVEDPGVADAEEEATERIPDHDTPDPVSPRDAMPEPASKTDPVGPADSASGPDGGGDTDRPAGTSTGPLDTVSNGAGSSRPASGGTGDGSASTPVAPGQTATALEELRLAEMEAEKERAEAEAAAADAAGEAAAKKDTKEKEKKPKKNK